MEPIFPNLKNIFQFYKKLINEQGESTGVYKIFVVNDYTTKSKKKKKEEKLVCFVI